MLHSRVGSWPYPQTQSSSPSAKYFSDVKKRPSLLPPKFYRRDAREGDEEGDEDDDGGEDLAGDPETAEEIAELVHQAGDDALEASHLDKNALKNRTYKSDV